MSIVARRRERHALTSINSQLPLSTNSLQKNRGIASSRSSSTYESNESTNQWIIHKPSSMNTPYSKGKTDIWRLLGILLLIFMPWIPIYPDYQRQQVQKRIEDETTEAQNELLNQLHKITREIKEATRKVSESKSENDNSYKELKKLHGAIDVESKTYLEAEQIEEKYLKRMGTIQSAIQENDKSRIENLYGTGPTQVKIDLQQNEGPVEEIIVTLDNEHMPHSSHHFLQMADNQLWRDLPLMKGIDESLLVASPSVFDGNHRFGTDRFRDAKLMDLAFPEYFTPQEYKYSMAFTRNGGPAFVIRMDDRVPKDEEDESTFAFVTKGFDTLDIIMRTSREENFWKIRHMTVLFADS